MAFSLLRISTRALSTLERRSVNFTSVAASARHIQDDGVASFRNQTMACTCTQQEMSRIRQSVTSMAVRFYSKKHAKSYRRNEDIDDDSDSDDEEEHKPRNRGESNFWRRKMRTVHRILDVNKDGVISYDDFKLLAERFVSLGHLSEAHEIEFQKVLKELWEQQWGTISPYNFVTVETYIDEMQHVLNDKHLKGKVHEFLPYLFKAVDKDKSGEISIEEFKLFFQCLGLSHDHAIATFCCIDKNHDGKLTLKEFVKIGRKYFISDNECSNSALFWGPLADH